MSGKCQKQTFAALFDHLIRARRQRRRHFDAQRLCGAEVDHEFELGHLNDGQIGRLGAFQNAASVDTGLAIRIGQPRYRSSSSRPLRRSHAIRTSQGRPCRAANKRHKVLALGVEER